MYGKRSWLIRGFTSHLFGQTRHPKAVGSKPRKTTPPPNGYRHHKTGQASSRHETCKTTPQATSKTKAMVCRWSARNMQDYPPMGTSSIRQANERAVGTKHARLPPKHACALRRWRGARVESDTGPLFSILATGNRGLMPLSFLPFAGTSLSAFMPFVLVDEHVLIFVRNSDLHVLRQLRTCQGRHCRRVGVSHCVHTNIVENVTASANAICATRRSPPHRPRSQRAADDDDSGRRHRVKCVARKVLIRSPPKQTSDGGDLLAFRGCP